LIKKAPAGTATQIADERQSQLKLLIARGKEQGYLTYAEVNDHLPSEIVDPEQIEDIVNMINDMGIPVYEKAPDAESLLLTDATAAPDEEAVEEATAALANLDAEFGRTTDPVRMYMREMGTVELLTREGEIRIAKRIEEGLEAVKIALGSYPGTYDLLLRHYETVKAGQMRLVDVIVGFVDPNAPDEIAQPQNPKMMALEREEAVSRAKAIVMATTHFNDPKILAEVSEQVTGTMKGLAAAGLDKPRGVALGRLAERIVWSDEIPGVAAGLHHGASG